MDGQRFDRWARAFAAASSRRGLIKGLAGTLAAGFFAAGGEDVEAARTCQRCRRGVCTFMPAGTRCGVCGTCDGNGGCNVDSGFDCGPCKECSQASHRCENKPADAPCGDCATCQRGRCRKTCRARERCCPPNTCAAAGVCCPDEERCGEECCERATERCTADGCCPTARVCGTGSGAHCCGEHEDCLNGSCCPRSQICRNLELGIEDCCADDEICCPSDHRCKPAKECCKEQCTECEACENGECVPKSDNTPCASGICCGGVCRASACCDDSGCPEPVRCRCRIGDRGPSGTGHEPGGNQMPM
ncbi:MAG: hypothetical protein QOF33_4838 [Thermomicrobiales bacterium]|nr:hypothetical protein [Thermomicrobiales bacterium]